MSSGLNTQGFAPSLKKSGDKQCDASIATQQNLKGNKASSSKLLHHPSLAYNFLPRGAKVTTTSLWWQVAG